MIFCRGDDGVSGGLGEGGGRGEGERVRRDNEGSGEKGRNEKKSVRGTNDNS